MINRYLSTLMFNVMNSFISFLTSVVVVRSLTPSEYGNYQFLLSLFIAIFTFSNFNTQNCYFTFISQRKENFLFYKHYLVWEFIQLFVIVLIAILLSLFDFFLGLDFLLVILALVTVFLTKNIRDFIANTFESQRMTSYYLRFTFLINFLNLIAVAIFTFFQILSIQIILILTIIEFTIYFLISIYIFWKQKDKLIDFNKNYDFQSNIKRYYIYAKPLFFSSLISFFSIFLERWLLQKFAGPEQQAYLALALQFSTIILIFTTSMLKVLWKEISEHIADKNIENLKELFGNATKNIFILTTLISLFFVYNAKEIITIVYGDQYLTAVYVFMFINFYTIHQTLGQLYGTFMLASEETQSYSYVSIIVTIISITLIFFVILPHEKFGLGLGAIGIAFVMVSVQLISVNIMGYLIKKKFGLDSMFWFQFKYLILIGIILLCFNSIAKYIFVNLYFQLSLQIIFITLLLIAIFFEKIKGFIYER